jgi:hypothetical protein
MNPRLHPLLRAGLLTIFLVSCEEPSLRQPPVLEAPPPAAPAPAASPAPPPPPPAAAGSPEAPPAPPSAQEPLPEAEPELSVAIVGNQVVLSGALKSRLQVERIQETLKREFPDHELKSDLKIEHHRIPVGWGNRVDQFIAPYLKNVANGRLSYRNTVVTLEGTVKSQGELRMISEAAVETFSGSTTTDIENRLKVEEAKP